MYVTGLHHNRYPSWMSTVAALVRRLSGYQDLATDALEALDNYRSDYEATLRLLEAATERGRHLEFEVADLLSQLDNISTDLIEKECAFTLLEERLLGCSAELDSILKSRTWRLIRPLHKTLDWARTLWPR